ncbi:MAG: D-glycero-beta-D-manno-heptose 1,7-bisphosphate 7-phosphatase [Gammaproteobacteria bacterium]|nr:D-glycero-beta-D-manno-heptose 1,7-bisphosphate 7-phosphatase [Gammaproteobacteria bacterium]
MTVECRRLVVLDRDGVINHESAQFIRSPAEWIALPGAIEAIAALTAAGFDVVVASNQSGVGRGLFTAATLDAIHRRMVAAVEAGGGRLAGIFVCPHAPDAGCECRKPKPGLLRQIEAAFGCSLAGVPVVGDSGRDLRAAQAVGARAILVRTGNGRATEAALGDASGVEVFDSLAAVAATLTRER